MYLFLLLCLYSPDIIVLLQQNAPNVSLCHHDQLVRNTSGYALPCSSKYTANLYPEVTAVDNNQCILVVLKRTKA